MASALKKREPVKHAVLIRAFGIAECTLYRWLKRWPNLPDRIMALRLLKVWKNTCRPIEGARSLGISASMMDECIKEGRVRVVELFGKTRVWLPSVHELQGKVRLISTKDVVHPRRRGFARLTPNKARKVSHQFTSKEARAAALLRWEPPFEKSEKKRNRRKLTVDQALRLIGYSASRR